MLLLVDGKRTVTEVLALALQAGAPVDLFAELVSLGLVSVSEAPPTLPSPPVHNRRAYDKVTEERVVPFGIERRTSPRVVRPPFLASQPQWAAPELRGHDDLVASRPMPLETPPGPGAPDEPPLIRSLSLDTTPSESVAAMLQRIRASSGMPVLLDDAKDDDAAAHTAADAHLDDHGDPLLPGDKAGASLLRSPAMDAANPAREAALAPPVSGEPPVIPETAPMALRSGLPPAALPQEDEVLLKRVRGLLSETLRFNAPLFTARTLIRVRLAASRREMIQLAWEIQQHLTQTRRSRSSDRADFLALEAARELLGMGNTQVAGDSQPGWTATQGWSATEPRTDPAP